MIEEARTPGRGAEEGRGGRREGGTEGGSGGGCSCCPCC